MKQVITVTVLYTSKIKAIKLWTMNVTTLVVTFSAPMPKSSGGLVVRELTSIWKT